VSSVNVDIEITHALNQLYIYASDYIDHSLLNHRFDQSLKKKPSAYNKGILQQGIAIRV